MNGAWLGPGLGLAGSVIVGLGMAASYGVMEASSSSPFCGTCHVMKSYHASWSESTHNKVACVECHIPSGLGPTIQKKLDGLSMLAKTLSGEVSSHISAHVADDVCLRCHERRLLVGREWFGSVLFDHRPHLTKLRRGVQLNCSSCHSQIVQGDHITVTSSSCLVCHFLNRPAEALESECALCHQVEGLVVERAGRAFDHSRAVELGIDCESCHEPMGVEASAVPRERCLTCHNRPERLGEAKNPEALMEAHISHSRAQCADCHREVRHVGKRREGSDLSRCEGCHRPRITPQLVLYAGLDQGSVGPMVSPMYKAGVRCQACHVEQSGMIAKPVDSVSCLECHPLGIERLYDWWRDAIEERQTTARRMLARTAAELGPNLETALRDADREIELVEKGRGVHNLELAMALLDSAASRIAALRSRAGLAPLELPWKQARVDSSCHRCHLGTESESMTSFGREFGHAAHVVEGDLECRKCHSEHEARRRGPTSALLLSEPECQGCHHEQIDTESCSSCHEDLHRAEFANARCNECHVAEFWSPAPGFDHQASQYPLTGAHLDVACAECHLERDPTGNQHVRYRGLEYRRCEDCHEDPHAVQLGPSCEECHITESWRMQDREALDHAKTRYALRGLHEKVECESCHPAGRPLRIENHETCSVCHRDEHLGQFAALEQGPECEPCHSVTGFLPTLYSPEHHDRSAFPLRGAHLAVPCNDCHQKRPVSEVPSLVLAATDPEPPEAAVQFRFASTECADCHDDPHSGSTDEFMQERGCESCHGEESWTRIAFDHRLESFALEGKHREVACNECHPRLPEGTEQCVQLRGVPVTCAGCHENPHLASATSASRTTDCERCHNADDWTSTPFEHRRDTRFPLIAAHAETTCGGCHVDSRYERASSECRDCHVDPHRGELGIACDRCHTPHSWTYNVEALTTHSATLFPLDGAHSTLDCAGCHDQAAPFEFGSTPTECVSCHDAQYRAAVDPNHLLLGLSTDCSDCHDSRSWTGATIGDSVELDHDLVFGLTGAHRGLDCGSCHQGGYAGTARDCMGCHRSDYERTREPSHALAAFPGDCTLCHTSESWLGATFDHEASHPLEGAHRGLDCSACHAAGYGGTSSDCLDCHRQDLAAAEPDHVAAGFDADCASCHNQRDWERAKFDHSILWPLTGSHRKLECAACHAGGYANTSSDCYACHRRDYRRVADPDHRAAGLGTNCEDCHGTRSWSGASLDHDEVFYLGGAHRSLECEQCHFAGYTGTPRDCYGCHQADYASVRDPNHRAAGYSTRCTDCHGTKSWGDVELDHAPMFPLTGAHREADCVACHAAGYAGTPAACVNCHQSDYDRARNPDHRAAGLATDCLACHTTSGWSDAGFDHEPSFGLTGAHQRADCDACHARGYAGTSPECASCHQGEYDSARDPDHRKSSLPSDCALCHTTEDWRDTHFAHESAYRLTGAHAEADCGACHARGYAGTPRYCSACHQAEYDATRNPDHRAAGFTTDCGACHGTSGWPGATLDHEPYYALTGTHTRLDCASCHAGGFAGTPRECAGCHLDEFEATVDPDHRSAGFPQDCTYCHDTDRWPATSFVHDTFYPLTGLHTALACNRCHSEGFAGTPRECAGCHLDEYLETTNPDHEAAQFPHSCESCHSAVVWYGAMFREHDTVHFPIYEGSHEGRWGSCKTCHRLAGDYQYYTCTVCHTHRRDKMDRLHVTVPGYEFLSTSCYGCHPTGEAR